MNTAESTVEAVNQSPSTHGELLVSGQTARIGPFNLHMLSPLFDQRNENRTSDLEIVAFLLFQQSVSIC